MRNFKKFLTLVLAVMMVVSAMSFTTSAATTKFEDVDADNEALVEAVDLLSYMGITKGVSETSFGADQAVTREQFALFMYRLMKGGKDAPANASNTTGFADLTDPTYNYAISWAKGEGIVNGTSDTTFNPKGGITLQDAYTMVVRALDYETEETLVYPHGYIEVAEKEGVTLDAGLDSSISYLDTLTRADMAIILYNAFFAETGVAEIETALVGSAETGYVIKETKTYPRLCEETFDVTEVLYQAVATPNYALAGEEVTADLGYDAIYFTQDVESEDYNSDVATSVYLTAEQLGLDADELNDYFLGEFTMFVSADKDGKIEKVLFADCNMVKKTVTDIKLGEVSTNKEDSYFAGTEAKLLSGKITADGEVMYAFNAPYTYIEPAYANTADAANMYAERNAKNLKTINFVDQDNDDYLEVIATEGTIGAITNTSADYGQEADLAEELLEAFTQVYYGGLYEADIYDVDGDGIYDYIDYKEYELFQVDTDEDEEFAVEDSDDFADLSVVYTNGANVIGEKFEDKDLVIGYVDEDTNTVKVAAVVEPTVATVKSIKSATKSIVLADGTVVNTVAAWQVVNNFAPENTVYDAEEYNRTLTSDLLNAGNLGEEVELYIYDGVVLFHGDVASANRTFNNKDLIIPLAIDGKPSKIVPNYETFEDTLYIYAYVDGEAKYVPVATEDGDENVIFNEAAFVNQLCSYTVDSKGIYTITSLEDLSVEGLYDEDVVYLGTDASVLADAESEEGLQVIVSDDEGTITKTGSRFKVGTFAKELNFTDDTEIIVLVTDVNGKVRFETFDATTFTASLKEGIVLDNMSYVLSNNSNSKNREYLDVLFATFVEEEGKKLAFEGKEDKNGYRIVKSSTPGLDADENYRNYYELLNPFTGKVETDVAGSKYFTNSANLAPGKTGLIKLVGGEVDESVEGTVLAKADLVWISEFEASDNIVTVVPTTAVSGYANKDALVDAVEGSDAAVNYEITDDTAVSVVKYNTFTGMFAYGSFEAADVSAIVDKDYFGSQKVTDKDDNKVTRTAPYVQAFISTSEDDDSDYDVVDYIIIVVTSDVGEENVKKDTDK